MRSLHWDCLFSRVSANSRILRCNYGIHSARKIITKTEARLRSDSSRWTLIPIGIILRPLERFQKGFPFGNPAD